MIPKVRNALSVGVLMVAALTFACGARQTPPAQALAPVYAPPSPAPELAGGPPEPEAPPPAELSGGPALTPPAPTPAPATTFEPLVFHPMAPVPNPGDQSAADDAKISSVHRKQGAAKPHHASVANVPAPKVVVVAKPAPTAVASPAPLKPKPVADAARVAPAGAAPAVVIAPVPIAKPAAQPAPPKADKSPSAWMQTSVPVDWATSPFPWMVGVAILLLLLLLIILIIRAAGRVGGAADKRVRQEGYAFKVEQQTASPAQEERILQPVLETPRTTSASVFANPMMAAAAGAAVAQASAPTPASTTPASTTPTSAMSGDLQPFHGQIGVVTAAPATVLAATPVSSASPLAKLGESFVNFDPVAKAGETNHGQIGIATAASAAVLAATPVSCDGPLAKLGETFANFDPLQLATQAAPPAKPTRFAGLTQLEPAIFHTVSDTPHDAADGQGDAVGTPPFAWYGPVVDQDSDAASPIAWQPPGGAGAAAASETKTVIATETRLPSDASAAHHLEAAE